MTRKKSRKAPPKRKGFVVPTIFDCPFCNHHQCVDCTMDRKLQIGTTNCKICGAHFQTQINTLSDPIDVYSEWIDECENINRLADEEYQQNLNNSPSNPTSNTSQRSYGRSNRRDEDEDDDPYGRQMYAKQRSNKYRKTVDEDEDEENILSYEM